MLPRIILHLAPVSLTPGRSPGEGSPPETSLMPAEILHFAPLRSGIQPPLPRVILHLDPAPLLHYVLSSAGQV